MDSDVSAGGVNSGARPMEMIALGLAGCSAMDVISILQKKKQAVTDLQIHFHGERAGEHPKVFTQASVEFHFHGKELDEAAIRRAIELSVGKYCPAYAMLTKAFPIQTLYKIFDADSQALLIEGEYVLQTAEV